jgi:hypothetical protein
MCHRLRSAGGPDRHSTLGRSHTSLPIADEDHDHIGPFLERFIRAATPKIEGGLR